MMSRSWVGIRAPLVPVAVVGWFAAEARGAAFQDCVTQHGGVVRTVNVLIPQQGGGPLLTAKAFAPQASLQVAPCPCLVMLPGSSAEIPSLDWAATLLARAGYVVLTVKPQLGTSTDSYNTAAKSGMNFLNSASNPYLADSDPQHMGGAGWSLGGRSLVRTQEEDARLDAIVAWDHLAKSEFGDSGSPFCIYPVTPSRIPRVPAMGQASDTCPDNGPQCKKIPWNHWRVAGMPSMVVVFEGWDHYPWGTGTTAQQALSHYYTQAWFDRWLKNDPTATSRLLAQSIDNQPIANLLSDQFQSAAYFDGYICTDLVASCALGVSVPGDLSGDGLVNGVDLALLLGAWGPCPAGGAPCPGDFDGNGAVNGLDVATLLGYWG